MTNCKLRSTAYQRFLARGASACISLLLVVTFAQALDSCEFAPLRTSQPFCAEHTAQSAPSTCVIWASAHPLSLSSRFSPTSADIRITEVCATTRPSVRSALQMFAHHVRPPPCQ